MIQEAYVHGVSTRAVDDLVQAMGASGVNKSQVSRLCAELNERVGAFLDRPIESTGPRSTAPILSNASMERSSGARTLSAFSPMKPPSLMFGPGAREMVLGGP